MFVGSEKKYLDEKGRISVPKKIREKLGPEVIVIKRSKKLFLYPYWYKDYFKPSKIFVAIFDKQGRLKIPSSLLRDFRGRWIIMRGKGEYIEITQRNRISYSEITIKEAEKLFKKRILAVCDADKKEIF